MSSPPHSDEVEQPRCYTATRVTRPPSNPAPSVKAPTLCRIDEKDARVPAPSTPDHHNPPLFYCHDCNGCYSPCRLAGPDRTLLCGACTTQYTPPVPAVQTLHGDGSGFSVYTEAHFYQLSMTLGSCVCRFGDGVAIPPAGKGSRAPDPASVQGVLCQHRLPYAKQSELPVYTGIHPAHTTIHGLRVM